MKVRGYRIELAEVEAALRSHPGISAAMATVRDDGRLAGYVVPIVGESIDLDALRRELRDRLPEPMVPSSLMVLDSLPISANGKVDRRLLPAPSVVSGSRSRRLGLGPRDPAEAVLAAIVAEVLGVADVDVEDDLFGLGMDSIRGIQIVSRARSAGLDLKPSQLYRFPTVAGLAASASRIDRPGGPLEFPHPDPHLRDRLLAEDPALEDAYPLSPVQEGMLFHSIHDDRPGVYIDQFTCLLPRTIDEEALVDAWKTVVSRHPALRTAIRWAETDRPVQVVFREAELPVDRLDWDLVPDAERADRLEAFLARDRSIGFVPTLAPLLRLTLIRSGEEGIRLVWSFHHMIVDGWCLPILLGEVLAIAERRRSAELPRARPFRDFLAWLGTRDSSASEAFWRRTLSGFVEPTPLGIEGPSAPAEAIGLPEEASVLDPETTKVLESLARAERITLSTIAQGAWAIVLGRYSGRGDVVFGAAVAGRPADLPGVETMVGMFINTIPLRVRIDEDAPAVEWLRALQRAQVERLPHEFSPPVSVQTWSDVHRGRPLYRSVVVFENFPIDEALKANAGGLGVRDARVLEMTHYPLTLTVVPGDGLGLRLGFDPREADAEGVGRMLGHLKILLESLAADPHRRVGDLSMMTEAEREQLGRWSAPGTADADATARLSAGARCLDRTPPRIGDRDVSQITKPTSEMTPDEKRALVARLLREKKASGTAEALVHRAIEAQAARSPDAPAVSDGQASLSYRELNERSNRLARLLRQRGVGPETLVGLFVGRSASMMVGLLGILKAGGAYVPLDPIYPPDRLAFMLDDSEAKILVTETALLESLPIEGRDVVRLDSDWDGLGEFSVENLPGGAKANNLAYVIYTSGSTGKPKGVMVEHGSLRDFLKGMREILTPSAADTLLAVTTLSFDIAALEMYLPLTVGAKVEIASREEAADAPRLIARLERDRIGMMQATPATWRLLLEGGWTGRPELSILCGGEALPRDLADRLLPKGRALWNLYGPTETTIWSSAAKVEPGEGPVTIGRPIPKTQMYVLDGRFRPVPMGVAGELFIGGAGLARGYLNRPGFTAERFGPDPFAATPGGRLYRTGDMARWRPDGSLECLGRSDHQVKIRGFRVELGEIEAALAGRDGVAQAVVSARDDAMGEKRLVAYLVPRPDAAPNFAEIRSVLAESLPEYMVPSAFVILDALPLTPNGKVDRNALPDPSASRGPTAAAYVPPRGPIEAALVGMWAELLGVDRVGIFDNFFELGGHSLFATQLLARLRDVFAVEPSLKDFLDNATVASLGRLIEKELTAGTGLNAPAIARVSRDGPLPSSFAQQRLWFLDQLEPGRATYNIPTAVRLSGDLDVSALETALGEIVRRHEVLRTTFEARGGVPFQVIVQAGDFPLPIDDLSAVPEADRDGEVLRRLADEARRPFDLSKGPMLRARLLKLADRENVALVTMHHIASDGWSIGVLIREVAALYDAFRRGEPSPLPDSPLQYADFAAWQRDWLRGDVLRKQLDYWTGRLSGVPALEVPTDRPRPAILSQRGGIRASALSKELMDGVRSLSRSEGATPFMTLLAAFQVLLHRYSGQDDFAVGSPIAGRNRSETENLIGFFVNTLVLRANVTGEPSFRELLARVRREALGAYAHQDLPFDGLVGVLHPARDPSRTPLFQVMFVLQNAPMPPLESPELTLSPMDIDSGTAKFDLTLSVSEDERGPVARMEYASDLFDPATIDRMLGHFRRLLESIVAQPDGAIGELTMLSEEETRRMLGSWGEEESPAVLDGLTDEELDEMLSTLSPEDLPIDD